MSPPGCGSGWQHAPVKLKCKRGCAHGPGCDRSGTSVDTSVTVYRQVMDVNFFGALQCTKVALASLIERQGTIIVIESLAGVAPLLGRSGYCASKHALHGLFTSLRAELIGSGVHIMIVCPGFVKTNLQTRALGADGHVTRHPQSTVGRQDSPARLALLAWRAWDAKPQRN